MLSEPSDQYPEHGGLVCLLEDDIKVIPFDQLRDPVTGHTRVRTVNVEGEGYLVARKYMIRLEKSDLADCEMRSRLAKAAGMTPGRVHEEVQRRGRTGRRGIINIITHKDISRMENAQSLVKTARALVAARKGHTGRGREHPYNRQPFRRARCRERRAQPARLPRNARQYGRRLRIYKRRHPVRRDVASKLLGRRPDCRDAK